MPQPDNTGFVTAAATPHAGSSRSPALQHVAYEFDDGCNAIDLTIARGTPQQHLPSVNRYWRARSVRRNKQKLSETEQFNLTYETKIGRRELQQRAGERSRDSEFSYISGPKYFFQRFIRQYPVGALLVWVGLFLVELAMVVIYIVQTTFSYDVSWVRYDTRERSGIFYAQFVLSLVSLLQLFFGYSLNLATIIIVVATTAYKLVVVLTSFGPGLAWVSRLYVPFFLRCWPMRQYFLFILDSISIMSTRNRKLDLLRVTIGPLTLFACMVFTMAEVFRINQTFRHYPMNMAVSLYFLVVTVSTVGFGDITADNPDGKALTIFIIFLFVAKMPVFIQAIRSTANILRAFRAYKGRRNHFIVLGRVSREEAISIMDEVFCLYPMKSVCFANKDFPPEVLSVGRDPRYRLRSTFLFVDPVDAFALRRMKASDAAAIIILPIREGYSSRVDDDVMLSSLIIDRNVPHLPQYAWLRYGLHVRLLKGITAAVVDEHVKKNIMATSLLLPGIVPFLVNLVRTAYAVGEEAPTVWLDEGIEDWQSQYEYSRRNVMSTCAVPARFVNTTLANIVLKFKYQDVLIVSLDEGERNVMHLDLDYVVGERDVLVAVYERHRNSLARALEVFAQLGPLDEMHQKGYGTHYQHSLDGEQLLNQNMNESFVFYPFSPAPDSAASAHDTATVPFSAREGPDDDDDNNGNDDDNDQLPEQRRGAGAAGSTSLSEEDVMRLLLEADFTIKEPAGVPLENLPLNERSAYRLSYHLKRREGAMDDPFCGEEERAGLLRQLEGQVNTVLIMLAEEYLNRLEHERGPEVAQPDQAEEVFLFVDQTTSIQRKTNMSVYEDVLSQTIAQYELYAMMQCITSVHLKSRLTLLTLRKYPSEFVETWKRIFGSPLRYIRGQGSLDSHLNFALTADISASRVRGILLYCSQMGPRDFGDVPIFTVENSVRDLLEWNERTREGLFDLPEQNIMVELESFLSSIKVSPFHSNAEWRKRGEANFQDCLAFMMGRCFSSNMLQPLMIHTHRDPRIVRFFELVLNLSPTTEMFDMPSWSNTATQSQTLFKLCGNQSLQFQKFGDAFTFLLDRRKCVTIGVFRLFPASETLNGNPRYFITNPPMQMPLLVEDIIYCLDGSGGVSAAA